MVLIYKPDFVKHSDGAPIFSVDCHPDGSRMATAGGDQKVKVWNLSAVKSRDVEGYPNVPKILATLSDHFNTVNCVRFSRNGRFLASGVHGHASVPVREALRPRSRRVREQRRT